MESADQYIYARVPWQVFASLTFRNERFRMGHGWPEVQRRLFRWLRWCAGAGEISFRRMLWLCRREEGEIGLQWHLHVLLGGLEPSRVNVSFNQAARAVWTSGHSRVREVEDGGEVGYLCKGMRPEDIFELRRFESSRSQLVESESLGRYLHREMLRTRKALRKLQGCQAQITTGQLPVLPAQASGT